MSKNPRRLARPVRLIVSVEAEMVEAIDRLMTTGRHHGHRNRAEFLRQEVERELGRCDSHDFTIPKQRHPGVSGVARARSPA